MADRIVSLVTTRSNDLITHCHLILSVLEASRSSAQLFQEDVKLVFDKHEWLIIALHWGDKSPKLSWFWMSDCYCWIHWRRGSSSEQLWAALSSINVYWSKRQKTWLRGREEFSWLTSYRTQGIIFRSFDKLQLITRMITILDRSN